jgi:hypothetical protein
VHQLEHVEQNEQVHLAENAQNNPAELQKAQNNPAELQKAQNNPAELQNAQNNPTELHNAQNDPAELQNAQNDPAELQNSQNNPTELHNAQNDNSRQRPTVPSNLPTTRQEMLAFVQSKTCLTKLVSDPLVQLGLSQVKDMNILEKCLQESIIFREFAKKVFE